MQLVLPKKNNSRKTINVVLAITFSSAVLFSQYFSRFRVPTKVIASENFKKGGDYLPEANEGRFSVLTYNIAGLPELISSAVTKRSASIAAIGKGLNEYDIVHVQEDFNYHEDLYNGGNFHAYRTDSKGGVPFGDGLNTLSKYPIVAMERIPWNDCAGTDCLTPKGFSYTKIALAKGVFVDFYNVHANAADDSLAAAARRKNLLQLSAYINTHSTGNAVIVMGDMNAHYCYPYDNVRAILYKNKLFDAWVQLKAGEKLPSYKPFSREDILTLTDTCETIDKILYRSSTKITLIPEQYALPNKKFVNEEGLPLSDHLPVSLYFSWQLN